MIIQNDIKELTKNVTPLNTFKFVAGTIVSCGAMAAISSLLKVPIQNSKGIVKIAMKVGVFVLACKAGDVAEKYFNDVVESTYSEITDALKEAKEEVANESNPDKQ